MDKAASDFNKASHALLDAEVRLNQVTAQVNSIEKEIALLNAVEANLEQNIRQMKRKRTVVRTADYGKAVRDLETCRNRRALIRIDLEGAKKVLARVQNEYDKAKITYTTLYDLMHNPPNNVIAVDFGRKNGQQRE